VNLNEFFCRYKKCALGYSGGVDSAYLLYKAVECNVDIQPYFVRSSFTTKRELEEAVAFADLLGCKVKGIDIDLLSFECIRNNNPDRCYYCKKHIFEAISNAAKNDGYEVVLEGTNASDDVDDRPGYRAICELGVISPLKICGLTKSEIRLQLKEAGFALWSRPATACLATRIPFGTEITAEDLSKVEAAEQILHDFGFYNFRIRIFCNAARIQVTAEQFEKVIALRREIYMCLSPYFNEIFLDLKER